MHGKLFNFWDEVHTSLWLVPSAMVLLAVLLRWAAYQVDMVFSDEEALRTWWLHSGSGDDARNLLSTLVAALITMASVMFSITMVVLTLAATQYGSRLVRTYMADPRTQAALGTFVMTIVYCLLVLRTVEKDMPSAAVPHVSVSLGLGLAFACILVLLFFLHAVARSIIAETVIRRVSGDLENSVRRMLPAAEAEPARDAALPEDFDARAGVVTADNEGYVQSIDYESLLDLAARHRVLIRFDYRAGEFMCRGGWLAFVYPGDDLNGEIEKGVRENVLIGDRRTPEQDLEFSIRHLVDIALRALSPAINDPNTAMAVVDRLRGALAQAMVKKLPTTIRHDSRGVLRIVGDDTGFDGIFDAAFHQIRQAAATHPAVVIHMLGAVYRLAEHVRTADQYHALLRHAEMIAAAGLSQAEEPRDRADIDGAFAEAKRKLQRTRSIRRDAAGSGRQDREGTVVMWRGLPSPP